MTHHGDGDVLDHAIGQEGGIVGLQKQNENSCQNSCFLSELGNDLTKEMMYARDSMRPHEILQRVSYCKGFPV